ncbi:MAG: hypothetical protein ACTSX8_05125 [Alphaproteobacteria bacterium]
MSTHSDHYVANLQRENADLKARLARHGELVREAEDDRATYSLIYLSLTGNGGAMPDTESVQLFVPIIGNPSAPLLGKITKSAGAAKSEATVASKRHGVARVLVCKLVPTRLISKTRDMSKWPR